jgi:plastocyanin domain-containing protein
MNTIEWAVLAGGIAARGIVNWWFFRAGRAASVARTATGGGQEVEVVVRGGYSPSTIAARAGMPLRLVFDRQETSGCSEEVVFPDFGIRKYLPAHARTTVEIKPEKAGTYEFTCGMSMLRGRIVVE